MPNSDTTSGVFNKITKEYRFYTRTTDGGEAGSQADDKTVGTVVTQSFSGNVETAKSTFLTADALTNNDTNATQLEYAITADGNGLKMSIAFGTKGAGTAEGDDWAATWATTKDTLVAAANHFKQVEYTLADGTTKAKQECKITDDASHLF